VRLISRTTRGMEEREMELASEENLTPQAPERTGGIKDERLMRECTEWFPN
jgi:hypothetical protein